MNCSRATNKSRKKRYVYQKSVSLLFANYGHKFLLAISAAVLIFSFVSTASSGESPSDVKSNERKEFRTQLETENPVILAYKRTRAGKFGVISTDFDRRVLPGLNSDCLSDIDISIGPSPEIYDKIVKYNQAVILMPDNPEPKLCKIEEPQSFEEKVSYFLGSFWEKPIWNAIGMSKTEYDRQRAEKEKSAFYFQKLSPEKEAMFEQIRKNTAELYKSHGKNQMPYTEILLKNYPLGSDIQVLMHDFKSRKWAGYIKGDPTSPNQQIGVLGPNDGVNKPLVIWESGENGKIVSLKGTYEYEY